MPSSVMNSTSYPGRSWTNTTVPRSPRSSPCSGRSSVSTRVSSPFIIVPPQGVGVDDPGRLRPGFDKPDRPEQGRSSDRRVHYTLDHVALAERRVFRAGQLVVRGVAEQGGGQFLPRFGGKAEVGEEGRLVSAVSVRRAQEIPRDLLLR